MELVLPGLLAAILASQAAIWYKLGHIEGELRRHVDNHD